MQGPHSADDFERGPEVEFKKSSFGLNKRSKQRTCRQSGMWGGMQPALVITHGHTSVTLTQQALFVVRARPPPPRVVCYTVWCHARSARTACAKWCVGWGGEGIVVCEGGRRAATQPPQPGRASVGGMTVRGCEVRPVVISHQPPTLKVVHNTRGTQKETQRERGTDVV